MDKSEALQVIKQLHSTFRGTLQEHEVIKEALKVLEE